MWSNYVEALTRALLLRWLWNTTFITVLAIVGNVLSSFMVAFGFARLRFPGKRPLFILLLSTMMLPQVGDADPPLYHVRGGGGWIPWPMIIPTFLAAAHSTSSWYGSFT